MPNITISDAAHKALMKSAKTRMTEGSIKTKGGWLLSIDDDTKRLLDERCIIEGHTDYSKVIVTVCK